MPRAKLKGSPAVLDRRGAHGKEHRGRARIPGVVHRKGDRVSFAPSLRPGDLHHARLLRRLGRRLRRREAPRTRPRLRQVAHGPDRGDPQVRAPFSTPRGDQVVQRRFGVVAVETYHPEGVAAKRRHQVLKVVQACADRLPARGAGGVPSGHEPSEVMRDQEMGKAALVGLAVDDFVRGGLNLARKRFRDAARPPVVVAYGRGGPPRCQAGNVERRRPGHQDGPRHPPENGPVRPEKPGRPRQHDIGAQGDENGQGHHLEEEVARRPEMPHPQKEEGRRRQQVR